jgi:hypothetical protein
MISWEDFKNGVEKTYFIDEKGFDGTKIYVYMNGRTQTFTFDHLSHLTDFGVY